MVMNLRLLDLLSDCPLLKNVSAWCSYLLLIQRGFESR